MFSCVFKRGEDIELTPNRASRQIQRSNMINSTKVFGETFAALKLQKGSERVSLWRECKISSHKRSTNVKDVSMTAPETEPKIGCLTFSGFTDVTEKKRQAGANERNLN